MRYLIAAVVVVLALAGGARAQVKAVVAYPHLQFQRPLFFDYVPDGGNRVLVVEQDGRVLIFENTRAVTPAGLSVAIDIRPKVRRAHNEEGLLGLAFHPAFKKNRYVFLHYSASDPRRNVLSRFTMDERFEKIDPASEAVILEVEQPWGNHNGGMIAFPPPPPPEGGKAGAHAGAGLYIALGDGGDAGDPRNVAQDRGNLLGKILRIDVDKREGGKAYAIPPDNPFVKPPGAGARGEVWAYGLRNVWRFSFDRETGALWAGDVGQNAWEEIDIIRKGGNYGWRVKEGTHDFRRDPGNRGPFIDPIVEHPRNEAWSITGGYVYRGQKIPALRGAYIYGDFGSGLVWALRHNNSRVTANPVIARVPLIASFGEDREGEVYVCSFDGQVYKFE